MLFLLIIEVKNFKNIFSILLEFAELRLNKVLKRYLLVYRCTEKRDQDARFWKGFII